MLTTQKNQILILESGQNTDLIQTFTTKESIDD